jgi:hypothetical protein
MSAAAIALRPKLLLRARELCGRRDVDAEDLVSIALLAMVEKPPSPRTETECSGAVEHAFENRTARTAGSASLQSEAKISMIGRTDPLAQLVCGDV